MIPYIKVEVTLCGITEYKLEDIKTKIKSVLMKEFNPIFANDIEIEIIEHAGKEE